MQIAPKKVVRIDYTLTDTAGAVIDSSKGHEPLPYLHGASNIVPGLEAALDGKQAGDTVKVTVQPDQAYGKRDETLVQDVPRSRFPNGADIKPGMQFQAHTPNGARVVTIVSATNDSVKIDANHPLAGKPLTFDVTVVDVRDATEEELAHGHVHGPGGHHHH
jgi:FKBP-type peptidyl-prolyl cis-trans isomerase SlyD